MTKKNRSIAAVVSFLSLISPSCIFAENWPQWRGPDGTGVSSEKNLPLKWSTNENVRWRMELPGRGNSSPIVWGNRVFVTQAVTSDNRRTLMCFDRANEKLLWQAGVTYAEKDTSARTRACGVLRARSSQRPHVFTSRSRTPESMATPS